MEKLNRYNYMNNHLWPHFKNNDLAFNVWNMKYRLNDESSEYTLTRLIENIACKIYQNIVQDIDRLGFDNIHQLDVSEDLLKMYKIVNNSEYDEGLSYINSVLQKYISYDNMLPGGSGIYGIGNKTNYSSISNCFVIDSPIDSLEGIHHSIGEMKILEKARGGVGINVSTLRPKGSIVKNQSKTSTGPCLFVEEFSNENNVVAQDGRRGALMVNLDVLHPDSREFIRLKQDLTKVTGANLSVLCGDEFMNAVISNQEYIVQRFPVDIKISEEETQLKIKVAFADNEIGLLKYDTENNYYFKVEKVKDIWDDIIHYAWKVAEPGILFSGNWKLGTDSVYPMYAAISTNPCVVGETLILTKNGHQRIDSLVGKEVEIWNGKVWSKVIPRITGENIKVSEVELTDGTILPGVTDYHKFPIWEGWSRGGHEIMTELKNLKIGDKISKFNYPVIEGELNMEEKKAYTQGFFSGDGTKSQGIIGLYDEKISLEIYMSGNISENSIYYQDEIKVANFKPDFELNASDWIPGVEYTIKTRLNWLSGLIDADGCSSGGCNGLYGESCQISSINKEFIKNLKLMLMTLGIESKYNRSRKAGKSSFPLRDKGYITVGNKEYDCKELWRLTITSFDVQKLILMGLNTKRVTFNSVKNRDARQFIKIKSIKPKGVAEKVYCFNEPFKHKGIFNGILLGNCSEIAMSAYDSCRLISKNYLSVIDDPFTETASINYTKLWNDFYWQLIIADHLIDIEVEHLTNIIEKVKAENIDIQNSDKSENVKENFKIISMNIISLYDKIIDITLKGRRCGCGFFGIADMLAALNMKYDKNSCEIIKKVCSTKMIAEVNASVDLSILRGSFVGYDYNLEKDIPLIKTINDLDKRTYNRMCKYGRRNVSWSTVAPTGTISILSGTTSGVEPLFQPFYKRRVKIFEGEADFTDVDGNKFKEFINIHQTFKKWITINYNFTEEEINTFTEEELNKYFQSSPWYGSLSNDIDPYDRIEILSHVQDYTTHSISSTFNLPEDTIKETISNIYLESYKHGLKGNTVYRENSRAGVILKITDSKPVSKRPDILKAKLYRLQYKNRTWGICVGEIDEKPYEVFILNGMKILNESDSEILEGRITKIIRSNEYQYDFESSLNEEFDLQLADLDSMESKEEKLLSLFISKLMRENIDIEKICKLIEKSEPISTKFSFRLNKILMQYYLDDKMLEEKCPNCDTSLFRENGCVSCKNCGWSKC
jgi:Ribonucleotide reductase, alpha subunit